MPSIRSYLKEFFLQNAKESESKNLSNHFQFVIKGNIELEKVIARIASNTLIKYSIMGCEINKTNIFYESQAEQVITEIFYYDMAIESFKYLSVIIDIIGENQLKNICLNKDKYQKKINSVMTKQEEYKSCLLSRVLEKEFSAI